MPSIAEHAVDLCTARVAVVDVGLAGDCTDGTYYAGSVAAQSDCGKAVMRSTCALLFPKCDASDAALGVCESLWYVAGRRLAPAAKRLLSPNAMAQCE